VAILSGSGVAREMVRVPQAMSYEADYTVENDATVPCAFLVGVTTTPAGMSGQGPVVDPGERVDDRWGFSLDAGDYLLDLQARDDDFRGRAEPDCHCRMTIRPAPGKRYAHIPRLSRATAVDDECAVFPNGDLRCATPTPSPR